MYQRLLAAGLLLSLAGSGVTPPAVQTQGGAWQCDGSPLVLSQSQPTDTVSLAWLTPPGIGPCWRGVVEAGPYPGRTGLRCGSDKTGQGGCTIELNGGDAPALVLRAPDGTVLWQDAGVGWYAYTPVWLEAVLEPTRVRAQMLAADGRELLAQSPWIPVATAADGAAGSLAAFAVANTARFTLLQRADRPLADYTPNNPSALRLPGADGHWLVTGEGTWRWQDASRRVLLQTRSVERTSALQTATAPRDGTWRCRVRLDRGTCGGGMLLHADKDAQSGFTIWLGGTYGNGRLMVYRSPGNCLWSGHDGVWKWDTDYVLEASRQGLVLRARLLAADGTTVLAESPVVNLPEADRERCGMLGFQTWRGTGVFTPEVAGTPAGTTPASAAAADLGNGWRAESGQWAWADNSHQRLARRDRQGTASARCEALQGGRGTFHCRVTLAGATAASLLFQLSPDGREGFEARFSADGLALRDAAGQTLWQGGEARCAGTGEFVLEGIVATDRIRVRLLDAGGRVLTASLERYVSDTNNARTGALGVRCEGGPAEFREWRWTAE